MNGSLINDEVMLDNFGSLLELGVLLNDGSLSSIGSLIV